MYMHLYLIMYKKKSWGKLKEFIRIFVTLWWVVDGPIYDQFRALVKGVA